MGGHGGTLLGKMVERILAKLTSTKNVFGAATLAGLLFVQIPPANIPAIIALITLVFGANQAQKLLKNRGDSDG